MSESLAPALASHARPRSRVIGRADPRRKLQLALGAIWLLDGLLQYQPYMFGKGFPQMLADTAAGNPAPVARPIIWSADIIGQHVTLSNGAFATIQVALGLGIAWRPIVKAALAASVAWALAVWWLGEGLGGVLTGNANPLTGAPGAVILYAVLAVLLWPADRDPEAPFIAARAVGRHVARAVWLSLWGSLAVFALLPASRAPHAMSATFTAMAQGQPALLAWTDRHAASALAGHGLAASIILAVLFAAVAFGIYLPSRTARTARMARAAIAVAVVLAVLLWLAEGVGGLFTGTATDPNSPPLLVLLALSFWPTASAEGA